MAPKEAEIAPFPDLRCGQQGTSFPRFHDQTEGIFSHTDANGNCPPWEELKSEVYQLGLGEPVGVSAEHGEGLLDLFEVLQPFGDLINLNKAAERERYAKILEAKEAKASRSRQGYRVRTNVDVVESSGATDEKNTRDLDDYIKCILSDHFPVVDDEKIEGEDAKFETVMLAFRTSEGLSLEDYRRVFGSDFASDFFDALKKHRERLELTNGRIRIKDEFLYVQNEILMDFLH